MVSVDCSLDRLGSHLEGKPQDMPVRTYIRLEELKEIHILTLGNTISLGWSPGLNKNEKVS